MRRKNYKLWWLGLLLTLLVPLSAIAGNWTANQFLYKPSLGARGAAEKATFDSSQDRVDARLAKEIWVGDPKYGTTLQDAVTAISSNPCILRVPQGTHSISANLTIPANITLKLERGAVLSIVDTKTLTLNGGLADCNYQIFDDLNTDLTKGVKFAKGAVQFARPEWWGAKADGTGGAQASANTTAIIKALYSGGIDPVNGWPIIVQLSSGEYMVDAVITMPAGTILQGAGMSYDWPSLSGTKITLVDGSNCHLIKVVTGLNRGGVIRDLGLACGLSDDHVPYDAIIWDVAGSGGLIENLNIYYAQGWGVNLMQTYSAKQCTQAIVRNCRIRAGGGIKAAWDSQISGNEIAYGIGEIVLNSGFDTDTVWTKGANWTISGGKAVHAAGSTEALSQSIDYLKSGEIYNVWFNVSERTAGSVTVSLGAATGSARTGDATVDGLTYCEALTAAAGSPLTLAITPTTDFDGKIDNVRIHYGAGIQSNGAGNNCVNNIVFGDAWGMIGIDFAQTANASATTGNRLDSGDYGVKIYDRIGIFSGNEVANHRRHGLYVPSGRVLRYSQVSDNHFSDNGSYHDVVQGGYGIYHYGNNGSSVIKNNYFCNNYSGAISWRINPNSGDDFDLIECNAGHDIQVATLPALPFNYNDAEVISAKYFRSAAVSTRRISRLRGGCRGKEVVITLGEAYTVLEQFSTRNDANAGYIYTFRVGTSAWSANLIGSTAAWTYFDATPAVGDAIYFGDVGQSGAWCASGERICGVRVYNKTPATATLPTLIWEYWNGASWATLTTAPADGMIFNGTTTYKTLKFNVPANSVKVNLNALGLPGTPPNTGDRHWVRCRVTVAGTGNPGTNEDYGAGLSYLNLDGDFGPLTTGQTGVIHLRKMDSGLWTEVSRFIN